MKWRIVDDVEIEAFLTEKLITKILSGSDSLIAVMAVGGDLTKYRGDLVIYLEELYKEMTGGELAKSHELEKSISKIVDSAVSAINKRLVEHLDKRGQQYNLFITEFAKVDAFKKKYNTSLAKENESDIESFKAALEKKKKLPLSENLAKQLREGHGDKLTAALLTLIEKSEDLHVIASFALNHHPSIADIAVLLTNPMFCGELDAMNPENVSKDIKRLMGDNNILYGGNLTPNEKQLVELIRGNSFLMEVTKGIIDVELDEMQPKHLHQLLESTLFKHELALQTEKMQEKFDEIEGIKDDQRKLKKLKTLKDEVDAFLKDKSQSYFLRADMSEAIKAEVGRGVAASMISKTNKSKISAYIIKEGLSHTLLSKRPAFSEQEVPEVAKKEGGFSAGYVSVSQKGAKMFMVKRAPKALAVITDKAGWVNSMEVTSLINEVLFGPFYYLSMGAKYAPKIGAVKVDREDASYVSMTSEFLANFKTMEESLKGVNGYNERKSKFANAVNKEVYFSAVLAGAEEDINLGNLGLVKIKRDGETVNSFAKIDHGRSGVRFFYDTNDMFKAMVSNYKAIAEVTPGHPEGLFALDLNEMIAAIDKDISIMRTQMEAIIDGGIALLESTHLDIRNAQFGEMEIFNNLGEVGDYYKRQFKTHLQQLEQYSAILKVIKSKSPDADLAGKWLTDICLAGKDIILYLHEKGAVVDGMPALAFAITHNITIKNTPPLQYVLDSELQINNRGPAAYLIDNNVKVKGMNPLLYFAKNSQLVGDQYDVIGHVRDNKAELAEGLKSDKKALANIVHAMTDQDKQENKFRRSKEFKAVKKELLELVKKPHKKHNATESIEPPSPKLMHASPPLLDNEPMSWKSSLANLWHSVVSAITSSISSLRSKLSFSANKLSSTSVNAGEQPPIIVGSKEISEKVIEAGQKDKETTKSTKGKSI